ncbi:serine/threonine protein kinase, partial [Streptomyces anulatus]
MSGVVVHLPRGNGGAVGGGPHGDTVTLRLGPGEAARFGRGSTTAPVELRLDDPAISPLAGALRRGHVPGRETHHSTT